MQAQIAVWRILAFIKTIRPTHVQFILSHNSVQTVIPVNVILIPKCSFYGTEPNFIYLFLLSSKLASSMTFSYYGSYIGPFHITILYYIINCWINLKSSDTGARARGLIQQWVVSEAVWSLQTVLLPFLLCALSWRFFLKNWVEQ